MEETGGSRTQIMTTRFSTTPKGDGVLAMLEPQVKPHLPHRPLVQFTLMTMMNVPILLDTLGDII